MEIIIITAIIISITFVIVYLKEILDLVSKNLQNCRIFIWQNKGLVDITFLLLYASLQLVFIFMISRKGINLNLVVSIYVLALLTLMGIERIFLRSRYNFLDKQMIELELFLAQTLAREKQFLQKEKELYTKKALKYKREVS